MRKILIFIIAICATITTSAQYTVLQSSIDTFSDYNFVLSKDEVQWVKIYEVSLNKDEINSAVRNNNLLASISNESDNYITGKLEGVESMARELGYRHMETPIIASNMAVSGDVIINLKDSTYRVIVKNLRVTPIVRNAFVSPDTDPFDIYMIRKSGKLSNITGVALEIFDHTLDTHFDISNSTKINDELNW